MLKVTNMKQNIVFVVYQSTLDIRYNLWGTCCMKFSWKWLWMTWKKQQKLYIRILKISKIRWFSIPKDFSKSRIPNTKVLVIRLPLFHLVLVHEIALDRSLLWWKWKLFYLFYFLILKLFHWWKRTKWLLHRIL